MHVKALAYLSDHGLPALPVSGQSMQPLLPEGSLVTVRPGRPRLGDIAVFCRGGELIIHRVVFTWGRLVYTMGDSSPVPDIPVHSDDIIGVVTGYPRRVGATFRGIVKTALFRLKNRLKSPAQK